MSVFVFVSHKLSEKSKQLNSKLNQKSFAVFRLKLPDWLPLAAVGVLLKMIEMGKVVQFDAR